MKERKIIQIASSSTADTEDSFRKNSVFALCGDGKVYMSLSSNGEKFNPWELLPSIPQDDN